MDEINSIGDLQELVKAQVVDYRQYGDVNAVLDTNGLILFNYSNAAQFAGRWNYFERISRGLILDRRTGEVIARPFDKFFNYGEDLPYPNTHIVEATEKLDGSLGILYRINTRYHVATRGAFVSDQALWATQKLRDHDLAGLDSGLTLLFEIIYPANRVVVDYGDTEALVLIAARDRRTGRELYYQELKVLADQYGFLQPKVYEFDSIEDILASAVALSANQEGWVLRYSDNRRFKVKGDAYKLAHKLMTGINFNRVLEAVQDGLYDGLIENVPDEFLTTIKEYRQQIADEVERLTLLVDQHFADAPKATRKEYALWVRDNCQDLQAYMFARLDNRQLEPLIYKNAFKHESA